MKKVIIIGSGPAGISAALYLQRSGKAEVLVISAGMGALAKAERIENYYGFAKPISGEELYKNGIEGARRLGVGFAEGQVVGITFDDNMKPVVQTEKNSFSADAVLIATGASRKTPAIPGLKEFEGKGVSYCAVCDAFFYRNKNVCVIGSGEYALHEAEVLKSTSGSVTILTDGKEPEFDIPDDINVITDKIDSVKGEQVVEAVSFVNGKETATSGIFVAVGVAGSCDLARKIGAAAENNHIIVNERMETTVPGIYAAGDCTGGTMQVYKAVYDGARSALAIINS